jgi:hypothetical protein
MPGFIGVGQGKWTQRQLPLGEVEFYYFEYPNTVLHVGLANGTIADRDLTLPVDASVLAMFSLNTPQSVRIWVQLADSPPQELRVSSDDGLTFTTTEYPIQVVSGETFGWAGPADVSSPTSWWNTLNGGEGLTGGLYRNSSGTSGDYELWAELNGLAQFSLHSSNVYGVKSDGSLWSTTGPLPFNDLGASLGGGGGLLGPDRIGEAVMAVTSSGEFRRLAAGSLGTPSGLPSVTGYPTVASNSDTEALMALVEGTTATVYRTTDGGLTWASCHTYTTPADLPEMSQPPVVSCLPKPQVYWAGWGLEEGEEGWWRTADSGDTWTFCPGPRSSRWQYCGVRHPVSTVE